MSETPYKSYGFEYSFNGKNYVLDVVASSVSEAEQRVAAMSSAKLIGELHQVDKELSRDEINSALTKTVQNVGRGFTRG